MTSEVNDLYLTPISCVIGFLYVIPEQKLKCSCLWCQMKDIQIIYLKVPILMKFNDVLTYLGPKNINL